MIKQLYKRKIDFLSFIMSLVIVAGFGAVSTANAAETNAPFLNYDMVLGDKDAPVELIEYGSTTCSHCATFAREVLPKIEKKYVETGKVKLIFRNYVFQQPFDVFASSLTRCVSEKKFFPLLGLYFKRQHSWLKYNEFNELKKYGKYAALGFAKGEAIKIAKIAGMKESEAYQCLARTDVLKFLMDVNKDIESKYESIGTPLLIVNGKRLDSYAYDVVEKAIEAALK